MFKEQGEGCLLWNVLAVSFVYAILFACRAGREFCCIEHFFLFFFQCSVLVLELGKGYIYLEFIVGLVFVTLGAE